MKPVQELKIAVLMGGFSAEREVSLRSGNAAAIALRSLGAQVEEVDVKDLNFQIAPATDVVFIALHGTGGEDGIIQGILEKRGIPFTGSGSKASELAFDKAEAKVRFRKAGLSTPQEMICRRGEALNGNASLRFPRVVKPSKQGSSIGIKIVREEAEMAAAVAEALSKDDTALVEEFISGREFTVGILGDRALPVIEIRPKKGWYDYANKYTKGATEYLVPAPIDEALATRLCNLALKAHHTLGCRNLSRSDFLLDSRGEIFILEVNTIPGMTETSLLPKAAAAAGISFSQLCLALVHTALNSKETDR